MKPQTHRRRLRGTSFIESLVALVIMTFCMLGMISLWRMSFAMTERHDRTSVGYNLARRGVEIIKQKGFNGPEYLAGAPLVIYYDLTGGGGSLTLVAGVSLYKVSITSIGDRADATALRTVIAIVTKLDTNTEVCRSGTYLVRSGL